jgi:hypothetical protein
VTLSIRPSLRRAYHLRGVVGKSSTSTMRMASAAPSPRSRGGPARAGSRSWHARAAHAARAGAAGVVRDRSSRPRWRSHGDRRAQPADENGFKLRLGNGPFGGNALHQHRQVEGREHDGGAVEEIDAGDAYLDALAAELGGLSVPVAA